MAGKNNANALYVGNLSDQVTEELLFELFLQAGPVVKVNIPKQKTFGFVEFKHKCSVSYAMDLMDRVSLFGRRLKPAPPKGIVEEEPSCHPCTSQSSPYERCMEPFPRMPHLPLPAVLPPCLPNIHPERSLPMHSTQDLRTNLNFRRSNYMQPSKSSKQKNSPAPHPINDIDCIPDFLSYDPLYYSNNGSKCQESLSSHRNDREPYGKGSSNYDNRNYNDRRSRFGKLKQDKRSQGFHGRKGYSNHRNNY